MVLEHVRRLVLTTALCVTAAPALAQDYMGEADVGSFHVELTDLGGLCAVSLEGGPALVTDLPAPCGFIHREGEDVPQMFTYDPVITVAFIAGPARSEGCADAGQSLKLDGRTFTLGEVKAISGGFCHSGGFDEVVFREEAGVAE